MSRIARSKACWAKAVSLSKVIDLRKAGLIRPNTASITEMVSAAVFPVSLAASVMRDLRSWRTRTGRVRLQMMRSPSQWPMSARASTSFGRPWMEEGVDGLEPQGGQGALMAGLEPARDLFGRPSFGKAIANEGPQPVILFEDRFTPPAQLIGSGGVKRRITSAGQGVAPQFPRHGGFCPLKRPGDGADGAAGRPHDRDLVSFLVQQMGIGWHCNTP